MFGAKKGLLQASFEAANVIDFSVGSGIESVYQLTANVCKLSAETKIDCDYIKKKLIFLPLHPLKSCEYITESCLIEVASLASSSAHISIIIVIPQ